MTVFYPDCSNNNWSSTQDAIGFLEQLVPEGFSGMCHKVSEGNYFEDPYWPPVKHWCHQHNLPLIGYHYVTTDDPAAQARTFQANNGGTVAMLDWEDNGGDLTNLTAVVDAFNTAGITIQLGYYPHWYWQQQGGGSLSGLANALVSSTYPGGTGTAATIYAEAGGNTGAGWAPYGGATPVAWQFTNHARIAGHTVDCNAYQGTDITVLFGTPTPPPARRPDSTTISVGHRTHPTTKGATMTNTNPDAHATVQSVAEKLDGLDHNGNPLPYELVDMLAPSQIFGLSTTYTYPEQRNTSPSLMDHITTLTKILSRTYIASDGKTYDAWDAIMTILEWALAQSKTT